MCWRSERCYQIHLQVEGLKEDKVTKMTYVSPELYLSTNIRKFWHSNADEDKPHSWLMSCNHYVDNIVKNVQQKFQKQDVQSAKAHLKKVQEIHPDFESDTVSGNLEFCLTKIDPLYKRGHLGESEINKLMDKFGLESRKWRQTSVRLAAGCT